MRMNNSTTTQRAVLPPGIRAAMKDRHLQMRRHICTRRHPSSAPERSPVVRRGDRRPVSMHPEPGSGDVEGRFELMTPGPNHQLEVLWVEVPAGVSTEMTPYSHGGEEVGVVLEGVHEVHIGGVVHVLEAGDSITYASDIPHWYRNPGPATVRAIWIITPPTW